MNAVPPFCIKGVTLGWKVTGVTVKINKPRRGTFIPNYSAMRDIEKAIESSKPLRDEIRRTFQVANRRIQNIEHAGLLSPAVVAANKGDISGFTKFSMKGDWGSLKQEYARALAFLSDATSTASGAREYKKALQGQLGLQNEPALFESIYNQLTNNINTIAAHADANYTYQAVMNMISDTTQGLASAIESRSVEYESEIQHNIEQSARDFFKRLANGQVIM